MLVRLILALLLAAFAMPAAPAACHDVAAPATAMTEDHHAMSDHEPARPHDHMAATHGCIGCIPPSDWRSARIDPPAMAIAMPRPEPALRLDVGRGPAPMLRPPRVG